MLLFKNIVLELLSMVRFVFPLSRAWSYTKLFYTKTSSFPYFLPNAFLIVYQCYGSICLLIRIITVLFCGNEG